MATGEHLGVFGPIFSLGFKVAGKRGQAGPDVRIIGHSEKPGHVCLIRQGGIPQGGNPRHTCPFSLGPRSPDHRITGLVAHGGIRFPAGGRAGRSFQRSVTRQSRILATEVTEGTERRDRKT